MGATEQLAHGVARALHLGTGLGTGTRIPYPKPIRAGTWGGACALYLRCSGQSPHARAPPRRAAQPERRARPQPGAHSPGAVRRPASLRLSAVHALAVNSGLCYQQACDAKPLNTHLQHPSSTSLWFRASGRPASRAGAAPHLLLDGSDLRLARAGRRRLARGGRRDGREVVGIAALRRGDILVARGLRGRGRRRRRRIVPLLACARRAERRSDTKRGAGRCFMGLGA